MTILTPIRTPVVSPEAAASGEYDLRGLEKYVRPPRTEARFQVLADALVARVDGDFAVSTPRPLERHHRRMAGRARVAVRFAPRGTANRRRRAIGRRRARNRRATPARRDDPERPAPTRRRTDRAPLVRAVLSAGGRIRNGLRGRGGMGNAGCPLGHETASGTNRAKSGRKRTRKPFVV